jgi:micrococcal nuclease
MRRPLVLVIAAAAVASCNRDEVVFERLPATCTVEHVSDGDTIRVSGCPESSVRLLLVDAPEVAHPARGTQPAADAECFGPEAAAYLASRLAPGTAVRLERGVLDADQFGRALRYAWIGDELINETLIREGYAVRYRAAEDRTHLARIMAAEDAAKSARRGLWAGCVMR